MIPSNDFVKEVKALLGSKIIPIAGGTFEFTELAKRENNERVIVPINHTKRSETVKRANERLARDYGELMAKSLPNVDGYGFDPTIVRKYSVPTKKRSMFKLKHGGRWYCEAQQLPKKKRKNIRFIRSKSVELDYSAMHIGLLYSMVGEQIDWSVDPYQVGRLSKYPRGFVKLALLRLVNSADIGAFKAIITRSGSKENKLEVKHARIEYENAKKIYPFQLERGFDAQPPRKPAILDQIIEGAPVGVTGEKFLKDVQSAHKPIAKLFGQPDLGIQLQWLDSEVMTLVLSELTAIDVPAIPIHDSVVVPKRHEIKTKSIMEKCYLARIGFTASVTA